MATLFPKTLELPLRNRAEAADLHNKLCGAGHGPERPETALGRLAAQLACLLDADRAEMAKDDADLAKKHANKAPDARPKTLEEQAEQAETKKARAARPFMRKASDRPAEKTKKAKSA